MSPESRRRFRPDRIWMFVLSGCSPSGAKSPRRSGTGLQIGGSWNSTSSVRWVWGPFASSDGQPISAPHRVINRSCRPKPVSPPEWRIGVRLAEDGPRRDPCPGSRSLWTSKLLRVVAGISRPTAPVRRRRRTHGFSVTQTGCHNPCVTTPPDPAVWGFEPRFASVQAWHGLCPLPFHGLRRRRIRLRRAKIAWRDEQATRDFQGQGRRFCSQ